MAALAVAIVAASGCAALGRRADRGDLPYFFKVDDRVYRGAHPTPEGLRRLSEMGVKTIVNLRGEDPRFQGHDRAVAELYGMRWVYLPMHAFWRPTDTQIREFLTLALDPSTSPIFLHCRQGEDRTGTLVAIYRVVGQGWEPAKAYQEARRMGLSWWNPLLRWVVLEEAPKRYAPMFPRPPERGE
jgi:protein tyrosine/serine phosphatase